MCAVLQVSYGKEGFDSQMERKRGERRIQMYQAFVCGLIQATPTAILSLALGALIAQDYVFMAVHPYRPWGRQYELKSIGLELAGFEVMKQTGHLSCLT